VRHYLLLFLLALGCILPAHGQTSVRPSTLKEQIELLKEAHAVKFVYDATLPLEQRYDGPSLQGHTLEESLAELFRAMPIEWSVRGKYVMLRNKRGFTVSGYVHQEDGETLVNATVLDLTTGQGTLTNEHGFFSLTLPEGCHALRFFSVGCEPHSDSLTLEQNLTLDVTLHAGYNLEEVVVTADLNSPLNTTQTGKVSLTASDFRKGYSLLSSPDLVKTLQSLGGVAAGTELVSGLYVHGGGNDENLILLDGTPLYQVNHLGGLFSAFNTDVVKNVDFYKSGFPARYGGRLSSVLDVRTADGDMRQLHGSFSIGLLDGRLMLEGPLQRDRTSFLLAMRRSWLDLITTPIIALANAQSDSEKTRFVYNFHDFNAKLTHIFSDRSRADLSFFSGRDLLRTKDVGTDIPYDGMLDIYNTHFKMLWGNATASMHWKYQFAPQLFSNVTLVYTKNRANYDYTDEETFKDSNNRIESLSHIRRRNHSTIDDAGYRIEMDYRPTSAHHVRFGSNYLLHLFRPQTISNQDYIGTDMACDTVSHRSSTFYRGHEFSLYAEDDIALTRRWRANLGLHYTLFRVDGSNYNAVEPRVALSWRATERLTYKASYTEMSQFMHLLSGSYLNLPTDNWVPTTQSVRPMHSRQYAAGAYVDLTQRLRMSLEGYYKTMSHLIEFSNSNSFVPSIEAWEDNVVSGKGRAYGAEVELAYRGQRTTLEAAYTLSWSERNFPDLCQQWYSDKFDNRHKLNLNFSRQVSDHVDFNAAWSFHSGNRMTMPTQYADFPLIPGTTLEAAKIYQDWIYEQPNNMKLPAYHRLDLGANFHHTTRHGFDRIWNLSVYNAYCHRNAFYAKMRLDNGRYRCRVYSLMPILPSCSYTLKF
jgi:hypothetical protein